MLLQILDEGRLTDAKGRVVNFKNTVIIMTSNLGSELLLEASQKGAFGFSEDHGKNKNPDQIIKEKILEALRERFKPEFLNRVDEIIVFHSLKEKQIEQIVDLQMARVQKRLADKKITLKVTEKAKKWLAEKGFDPVFGARPLKRAIQTELLDKMALEMIEGRVKENSAVTVDIENKTIILVTR